MAKQQNLPSFTWMYAVVLVLVAVPTFIVGLVLATKGQYAMLAAGCASIVAVLITWPIARSIDATRDVNLRTFDEAVAPLNERVEQMSIMLNLISEQQLLSDRAKSVAFRDKDRDAMRRALQEEIARQDWESAMQLANDIEGQFGLKQEAETIREHIRQRMDDTTRKQINETMTVIDRHIRGEMWADARAEAEQLAGRFPNDAQVRNLPQELENRRQAFKKQLIDSWHEALNRKDIDGSIAILKRLDLYLTPAEAEELQEPARNLFKEKLNALRTQFSLAVQDHRWQEALQIGDVIVRDFPNTRIAQEVREKTDALRNRATRSETVAAK